MRISVKALARRAPDHQRSGACRREERLAADLDDLRLLRQTSDWRGTGHRRGPYERPEVAPLGKVQLTPDDLDLPRSAAPTPNLSTDRNGFRAAVWRYQGDAQISDDSRLKRWARQLRLRRLILDKPAKPTLKGRAYDLRDVLRATHPDPRCACCGYLNIGSPALMRGAEGSYSISGVAQCASVWGCPVCAYKIKGRRATEITSAVELLRAAYGARSMAMFTFTTSHELGDNLKQTREGFQRAQSAFWNRVPSELKAENRRRRSLKLPPISWRESSGFIGYVTGSEVTTGRSHGWHFHRHSAVAFDRNQTKAELAELNRILSSHWEEQVVRFMGERFRPSTERGLKIDPLHLAKYISKLGLEIADIGAKSAGKLNRSIWELAESAAAGHGADLDLFASFCLAMKGAKAVQFSDSLLQKLKTLGLRPAAEDGALVDDPTAELVAEIPLDEWRLIRDSGLQGYMLTTLDNGGALDFSAPPDGKWGSGERVELEAIRREEAAERIAIQLASGARGKTRAEKRELRREGWRNQRATKETQTS